VVVTLGILGIGVVPHQRGAHATVLNLGDTADSPRNCGEGGDVGELQEAALAVAVNPCPVRCRRLDLNQHEV
jgi:hypothetical protein